MARSWWIRFTLMILTGFAVFIVAQGITTIRKDDTTWALVSGVVTAVLALVAYRYATRWIEKRRPAELSGPRWLIPGALAGAALFGLVMLVIWMLGGVGTVTFNSWIGLAAMTSLMISVAVIEELLFRGVLLRMIAERFGGWAALAVSAPLFGLPHLLNHGTDVVGVGELDVFRDESLDYAARLRAQGVPVELHLYPGAYHAFDLFAPQSQLATSFRHTWNNYLARQFTKSRVTATAS